jgi:hypothetical protein
MILDQSDVKMILVGRYDHRITMVERKQCCKEIEIIYEGKYSNPHI